MGCRPFKTSEANAKSFLRTQGAIDKYLKILDYTKFMNLQSKLKDQYKTRIPGFTGELFYAEEGGNKAIPNRIAFKEYDNVKVAKPNITEILDTIEKPLEQPVPIKTAREIYEETLLEAAQIEKPDLDKIAVESAKQVVQDILNYDITPDPSDVPVEYFDIANKARAEEIAFKIADKLSKAFNIPYESISSSDAYNILERTKTPYKGQSAFFFNGKVYLITNRITLSNVLHEFAHPLVKMIAINNRPLFLSLYTQLKSTPEGEQIIKDIKNESLGFDETQDGFIEEAIVRGLEKSAVGKVEEVDTNITSTDNPSESKGFLKFIKEILYQIKQLFRKAVGKVDVKDLKADTTLDELATMLTNEDFIIEKSKVTQDDIAMFQRIAKEDIEYLTEKLNNDPGRLHIQAVINDFYGAVKRQNAKINKFAYKDIKGTLKEEGDPTNLLNKLRSILEPVNTRDIDLEKKKISEEASLADQSHALINSVFTLKHIVNRLSDNLSKIRNQKESDSVADINTVTYYDRLLKTWDIFIKSSIKDLSEFLPADSPLMKELASIETNIKTANHHIYTILKRASADVLYDTLKSIRENIQRDFTSRMKHLEEAKKKPGANISMINKEIERETTEFKKHEITKDKLEATLRGETDDLNWFNKEAEGILNSNDPVIGAFGLILKQAHLKSERRAIDQNQERIMDLAEPLKKTGYSETNYNKYWDQYMFLDTESDIDEQGNVVEKKVWTLLNPVKDWRYEKRKRYDEFAKKRATLSKEELVKEAKELRDWDRKYFHQKYKSEYYSTDVIFNQTYEDPETKEIIPIGDEAWLERELILQDMKNLRDNSHNEGDEYEKYQDMDVLRAKYNQLYSLSFEDATPKKGVALAKAKLLREHRKLTQKFYEYKPIPNAFEKAFEEFVQYAQDNIGEIGSPEFKEAVYGKTGWLARNTRMSYAKEWYTEVGNIMEAIKTTSDRFKKRFSSDAYKQELKKAGLKVDDIDLDVSDTFTTIFDLMAGYKDENGERVASDMDPKRLDRLYTLQEDINKVEQKLSILTGLSVDEAQEYARLMGLQEDGPLDAEDQIIFNGLLAKKGAFPISDFEVMELKGLFKQLKAIQYKEPTEDYLNVMNTRLTAMKQPSIDKTTANDMLENTPYIDTLLESNKDFRDWFTKNHIKKEYYNEYLGVRIVKWERLYAWSVTKPVNDKFINKFKIKDPITGEMIERLGEPSSKFSYRQVKNEYRNIPAGLTPEQRQAYVGVVVNNMGEYLPKSLQSEIKNPVTGKMDKLETAPDNTFINEEYYRMKTENPDKFEVLEKTTKWLLKVQEGSSKESKLYLDIPRYKMDSYELMKTGKYAAEKTRNIRATTSGIVTLIKGAGKEESNLASRRPEDFDEGMANYVANEAKEADILQFAKLNVDNQDFTRIPVTGISNIQEDLVSKDLLLSMARYSFSLEKQKGLIEINPIAQGLKNVLNNPESHLKDMTKASLLHRDERGITKYNDKKGDKNKRLDLFNYIYGREFEGKIYGDNEGMDWLNKWSNKMMQGASFSFFALNIPSAIKNYWGALWQMNMEAVAGNTFKKQEGDELAETAMNTWSFAKGKVKAKSLIWDWTNSIYGLENAENVSLDMQLIKKFDPIQSKTEEKFGQTASRSFVRDLASMSFFYSPRKFMEIEAGLQLYAGMMNHQMVEITEDGAKHLIPYIEAFELDSNGQAKLRDGIDKTWDFGGDNFNAFINRMHETSNQLQGSFAKFDQPAAQRFFAYRLWSFMRRYFTAMFMARWSKNRLNFGLSNTYEGFYRTFGKSMVKLFTSYGKYWSIMSPKERKAMGKMLTDIGHMIVLYFAISMIFGYDDEDPERFAKLREQEQSGLAGWLGVHALSLSIATAQENESFTPLMGFGLDDYVKMTNMSSVAMGPTIETYSRLLSDIWNIGSERSYYQKDVGPYSWQKEGSFKFWNHLGRITGLSGKDLVPSLGIQSREGFAK